MAVNPLSLAESLRPWRAAGITHFLRDVLGSELEAAEPESELNTAPTKPNLAKPADPPTATPDTWPTAWQDLFARTKPAPILWTYPELGLDLSGQGSSQRSACLRELIGKLQLPRGSSTFWPLCLEENGAQAQAGTGIFKGGLFELAPKVVVLIGPRSVPLAGLGLDLHTPFTQQIVRGVLFVLLPEFSAMLENAALADKACVFLRSALGRVSL